MPQEVSHAGLLCRSFKPAEGRGIAKLVSVRQVQESSASSRSWGRAVAASARTRSYDKD
jgi:hypothetical protein